MMNFWLFLWQMSPCMRPPEIEETALSMKNITFDADDLWTTFEVIENGELGKLKSLVTKLPTVLLIFFPPSL